MVMILFMIDITHADACTHKFPRMGDIVIADPPMKVGVNNLSTEVGMEFTQLWLNNIVTQVHCPSWLVIFSIQPFTHKLIYHAERLTPFRMDQEVIWHYDFGFYTRRRFVPSHMNISILKWGNAKYNWRGYTIPSQRLETGDPRADGRGRNLGDVWSIPRMPGNDRKRMGSGNPTLPPIVIQRLLANLGTVDCTVLDLFCGLGTVPYVCKGLKYHCYSIDIDESQLTLARKRVYDSLKTVANNLL